MLMIWYSWLISSMINHWVSHKLRSQDNIIHTKRPWTKDYQWSIILSTDSRTCFQTICMIHESYQMGHSLMNMDVHPFEDRRNRRWNHRWDHQLRNRCLEIADNVCRKESCHQMTQRIRCWVAKDDVDVIAGIDSTEVKESNPIQWNDIRKTIWQMIKVNIVTMSWMKSSRKMRNKSKKIENRMDESVPLEQLDFQKSKFEMNDIKKHGYQLKERNKHGLNVSFQPKTYHYVWWSHGCKQPICLIYVLRFWWWSRRLHPMESRFCNPLRLAIRLSIIHGFCRRQKWVINEKIITRPLKTR